MLELKNLTCGYGKDPVLKDVSLSVKDGEFIAVIGPNGSGKTTFLRAVTKAVTPSSGAVLFKGKDISRSTFRELAKSIAVVNNLREGLPVMSVEDFVFLGRIPHRKGIVVAGSRESETRVQKALTLTDTLRLRERRMDSLSSGEKQMVLVARALAQEPILLLLDEPTSHLDIAHQVKVLDLVARLNRDQALTVITVLHDLNLAGQYCGRLLLVKDGRIIKDGPPTEVLTREIIEAVYGTPVEVIQNPASRNPYVFPLSGI